MFEQVFVVPRKELFGSDSESVPDGFREENVAQYLERIGSGGFFVDRQMAENDPALKQIIPYGLLCSPGSVEPEQVFTMRRIGGGDERLRQRRSIGVGGHINPQDAESEMGATRDLLDNCLKRELEEELRLERDPNQFEIVGVINDDSNPVGQVHFGVVYRIEASSLGVAVRETDRLAGEFETIAELSDRTEFETWSRFLLDHFWPEKSLADFDAV